MSHRVRLGVDVGGTFTDLVVAGSEGLVVLKQLSTPDDPSRAVIDGLDVLDPAGTSNVVHGTTVATNTILERRGARTAFVTTDGFTDLLALGRGARRDLYSLSPRSTPSVVPPDLCFGVRERVAADGSALRALTRAHAAEVARAVARSGAESTAVCLLFSYLAPAHERMLGQALATTRGGPECVSLSVDVLPEFREYERASTVVLNAYVAPVMARYLERLERGARGRPVRVMASHGGTLSPSQAARMPVATVLSGPAAGCIGALAVARRAGLSRTITFDMGGTSTDVALCDGEAPFASSTEVDGLPVHLPSVDIHTVGSGGGSLLWSDEGGALRVGPRSAGAHPGPACYGRGGRLPALTDAHLVLGRLPPQTVLADSLRLDGDVARSAVGELGRRLGLSPESAASGAVAVANAAMERALRRVSVERGYDPAEFVIVAFGGAGPLHACELADAIGARAALVPAAPGALSALGLASAPDVVSVSRSVIRESGFPLSAAEDVFRELERDALEALGGPAEAVDRLADVRYVGQSWELTVPWPRATDVADAFEAAYEGLYGYRRGREDVEVVTLRVRASGGGEPALPITSVPTGGASGATSLWLGGECPVRAPVVPRSGVRPNDAIVGPAVLTQPDATTYVAPGWVARPNAHGDLFLERA